MYDGDADSPDCLLNVNDTLYGLSTTGGSYNAGTVFLLSRKTNTETVMHSFGGSGDGGYPQLVSLIDARGILYGTTDSGGTYNLGTVFSIDPKSGKGNDTSFVPE